MKKLPTDSNLAKFELMNTLFHCNNVAQHYTAWQLKSKMELISEDTYKDNISCFEIKMTAAVYTPFYNPAILMPEGAEPLNRLQGKDDPKSKIHLKKIAEAMDPERPFHEKVAYARLNTLLSNICCSSGKLANAQEGFKLKTCSFAEPFCPLLVGLIIACKKNSWNEYKTAILENTKLFLNDAKSTMSSLKAYDSNLLMTLYEYWFDYYLPEGLFNICIKIEDFLNQNYDSNLFLPDHKRNLRTIKPQLEKYLFVNPYNQTAFFKQMNDSLSPVLQDIINQAKGTSRKAVNLNEIPSLLKDYDKTYAAFVNTEREQLIAFHSRALDTSSLISLI